eukprot:m.358392 g.358392  ORF g.358392 m.358392 type:complete len:88 (+) comp18138_c0_seq1:1981-2244(+)
MQLAQLAEASRAMVRTIDVNIVHNIVLRYVFGALGFVKLLCVCNGNVHPQRWFTAQETHKGKDQSYVKGSIEPQKTGTQLKKLRGDH